MIRANLRRLWRERRPELALFGFGVLVRLSLLVSFSIWRSYDSNEHWRYVAWFYDHWAPPSVDAMTESYHPPLYYFIGGMITRIGGRAEMLQLFAVLCGCARLGLTWLGIERWLPGGVRARRIALLLAAVLPASLFLDGMFGAEPLSNLLSTAMLLLAPSVFAAEGKRRTTLAAFLGLLAGLALLAKISALVIIGSIGAGAGFESVTRSGDARARLARIAPFFAALAVCALTCGFYFGRNVQNKGKPFLSSFDCTQQHLLAKVQAIPYFERRPIGYLIGWSAAVHRRPVWPSAGPPETRFWPQLLASTFADYYNYGYAPLPGRGEATEEVNNRPVRPHLIRLAAVSFNGGLIIAAVTLVAWFLALLSALRQRDSGRLVLLLAPLFATVGAVHFAWAYPFDNEGIVKGAYLQFACGPLFGVFGLAVERLWHKHVAYALVPLISLAAVTTYTVVCRLLPF